MVQLTTPGDRGQSFRELWVDGRRRMPARYPKRGYLRVAPPEHPGPQTGWDEGQNSFPFAAGDMKAWPAADRAEVVVMTRWVESHLPIDKVDEAKRIVSFRKKSVFHLDPGDPYYVENVMEFLTAPGEWYLDRHSSTLYYVPTPEEEKRLRAGHYLQHAQIFDAVSRGSLNQELDRIGAPEGRIEDAIVHADFTVRPVIQLEVIVDTQEEDTGAH